MTATEFGFAGSDAGPPTGVVFMGPTGLLRLRNILMALRNRDRYALAESRRAAKSALSIVLIQTWTTEKAAARIVPIATLAAVIVGHRLHVLEVFLPRLVALLYVCPDNRSANGFF